MKIKMSINWIALIGWIITALLAVIAAFVYRLPYAWQDKLLEDRKAKNSSQLQKEAFFQQIGGKDQKDVFDKWTKRLTYMDALNNQELPDLVHNTVIYGSDKTIAALSTFMQYVYRNSPNDDGEISTHESAMFTAYTAYIICCLKEDFSGYSVDPANMIRIKISDFDENKKEYQKCLKEIDTEVNKHL